MRKSLIVSAFALLAAAGVHAENYVQDGGAVLSIGGQLSRAQVQAQTADAVRNGTLMAAGELPFGNGSLVVPAVSQRARDAVRTEAVAAAHNPRQNLRSGAFTDSIVPRTVGRTAQTVAQGQDGTVGE